MIAVLGLVLLVGAVVVGGAARPTRRHRFGYREALGEGAITTSANN
jgi:hypothetical protein